MEIKNLEICPLRIENYKELIESMKGAYREWPAALWDLKHIESLCNIFPEGQLAVFVNNTFVGCALSIIVKYDYYGDDHTYKEITGNATFNTHNKKGDVLYGIDIFLKPGYRGLRLGRRLYDARKELCERLNLKAIVFGGRIPGFHEYSNSMTPKEYINKVKYKEIYDPILTFQLANDFHVKKIIKNYQIGDKESEDFAVLLQWDNIYYTKITAESYKTIVRLGLIQWQMRPYKTLDDLMEQVEYFVDTVSGYQADFVLFPEYFNVPLLVKDNNIDSAQAYRNLAEKTAEIRARFSRLAVEYNVNIIAGSMPVVNENDLYNTGYLCRRNGTWEEYTKIHITPDEVKSVGLKGGSKIQIYETDCCKIGILICYDVEFPEVSRLLADQGMKILFVPFMTDTQNGYARVRNCARARAIENECYVAISGSVGNLPKVYNMDIQFSQSAVFTPCDFSFPVDGIKAESTPNTETMLIVDVDLDLLKELHAIGTVRTLNDRRKDIYEIKKKI
ncbi:MAG: bifunctional GNAT family N-acetyltransferase/carbon-nitrogen hydrolase family protein [Spirochaetia bacterium]|nr:bifunctional GNAT family N-acetyltransferase/carbon-nitrogen hydrolase family protein [Spirochaetia bacterium]